mgnify:CR=1 FL=1
MIKIIIIFLLLIIASNSQAQKYRIILPLNPPSPPALNNTVKSQIANQNINFNTSSNINGIGGGGIGGGGDLVTIQGALTTFGNAERIAAREAAAPVVINVSGGVSTSAEIGQSVYNALLQYKQVYGPLTAIAT